MLVNITIPVFNEEKQIESSIRKLHAFLCSHCRFEFEIIIADNASTDGTRDRAEGLARELSNVSILCLDKKGRGGALKHAWMASRAEILSYMDVDLSTNLFAFPPLVEAVMCGGADLATGSRLLRASRTERGLKREIISRCYNILVKLFFQNRFSDAQCGFKAIRREVAQRILTLVEDTGWFFDTELMVLAEKLEYRVFEVPVVWVDDLDSRVSIIPTAVEDIKGLIRLKRTLSAKRSFLSASEIERPGGFLESGPSSGGSVRGSRQ